MIYTTLPERFAKLGHDVYLDSNNLCRNDDIYDLLWAKNPYVKGTSDKRPNAGYINQGAFYEIARRLPPNSVEAMERANGLPPPYSLAPKIYYEPQPFTINLQEIVLIDFSALSSSISAEGISGVLTEMAQRFDGRSFLQVTFPPGILQATPPIEGASVRVNSIFEYVDALASCYAWIGSEAGGQALAAAVRGPHDIYDLVKRPECICVSSAKTHNSKGYRFRNVEYLVTTFANNAGDFWQPHEINYERYQRLCRRSVEEARASWEAAKAAQEAARAVSA